MLLECVTGQCIFVSRERIAVLVYASSDIEYKGTSHFQTEATIDEAFFAWPIENQLSGFACMRRKNKKACQFALTGFRS